MDELAQIFLNTLVLVFGLIFIFPVSSKTNPPLYISLAWLIGWGIIVISEIVLIIAGAYVTLPKIAVISFSCLLVFWIVTRSTLKEELLFFKRRKLNRLCREFAILFLLSVLLICLLPYFGNYIFYSPDSLQVERLSRMFHKYGAYGKDNSCLFSVLFGIRVPFYVIIHNVGYLSGIKLFYSFTSATTFFTCLGLWGFWRRENHQSGFWSTIWLLLVLTLFLSNRLVVFHSFYLLTNLTTMAYYTFGILSLYEYLKKKESFWFILACFFLGCTGLVRKEMLLFSLLPFLFVSWKNYFPRLSVSFFGFALYSLFAYLWFSWGILGVLGISEVIETDFKTATTGLGGALIVAFCFILSLIIFFFPWHIIKKRIRIIVYLFLFISLVAFSYYFENNLTVSVKEFCLLAFRKGCWGSFWYLLFLGIFIYVFLRIVPVSFRNLLADIRVDSRDDNSMDLLTFIILAFLISRVILYAIINPFASHYNASGNRILLHIYPVAVYFLGRVGFICSKEITKWKNYRSSFQSLMNKIV